MGHPRKAALAAICLILLAARPAFAEMSVAVLEFTSAAKDPELAPLGKGLQSMVTTDLSTVQSLKVVERERLKDIQGELKLSQGKGFDKSTAAKIGKLSGATHLLVGSFTVLGESMRLDGRLISVATGEVLLAEQIAGEKALFFELEQKLVQKIIAALGVKLAPKERATLARPHTADFGAFQKYSEGIQAFDDGRLEDAMQKLNQAATIDSEFKLASLTLAEYERLASQVRGKAEAAGRVEDELERLEKNKAIAAEVAVIKKLWPILDRKGNSADDKLLRVAAACVLENHYRTKLGFQNRGPVSSSDLAAAGFDDFSLKRTADTLAARAWAEAPDVFPRVPPLCSGFGMISADRPMPIEKLLGYEIDKAAKIAQNREALLSYMSNNAHVDPAAEAFHLDPPGEVRLWERLYALAQKLPGLTDDERASFEETLAEKRREAGDFDGSTQMYAAASKHTKASHKLAGFAKEIDKNKKLKLLVGQSGPLREYFLLKPGTYDSELERMAKPESQQRLRDAIESARDFHERNWLIIGDLPAWRLLSPTFGARLRTGPRTSRLRADELRYEGMLRSGRGGDEPPKYPTVVPTTARGRRFSMRATLEQTAPPEGWKSNAKTPPQGGGHAGFAFGINRIVPDGGIEKGKPAVTIAHAVLVSSDRVRLVKLTRDGEHKVEVVQLGEQSIGSARGKRNLEVRVEASQVVVSVDGKRASFPYKAEGDGFAGFVFDGVGYAGMGQAKIKAEK